MPIERLPLAGSAHGRHQHGRRRETRGSALPPDATLDLSKLNLPPMTRMMAEAAQRYGMIVRDQTNWAVAVFAEDPSPTGTRPFGGPTGFYGRRLPSDLMKAFRWDRLQLLEMDLHGG
jgi:hypothetical protein